MPTYNPLDSRFLTTANAITRDGQKFVRVILDVVDNVFYTLDDDGNFNPIGSGGTSSSGVTSINVGTGLSANSTTGAVTIVNTGVTGSGVVNTLNDVYYFPLWTATTPTASAVTTTQLTTSGLRYLTGLGIVTSEAVYLQGSTIIGTALSNYTMPNNAGTNENILSYDNASPAVLGWNNIIDLLPENLYGNLTGGYYDIIGVTQNDWYLYEGSWVRHIQNGISIGSPPAISINDPLYSATILSFNVTGILGGSNGATIEIGWGYNDNTAPNILGSYQTEHMRSGDPRGHFNCNFLAEINQGSNDFYLFARDTTGTGDININNVNVVITTIYSPNA